MKKIYLATPYTPPKKWRFWPVKQFIEFWRFLYVSKVAMRLMSKGLAVYSPISHTAPISWFGSKQKHDFWLKQDYIWLEQCDELWILSLKGWRGSYGIAKEIKYAEEHGIRVVILHLDYSLTREDYQP